MPKDTCKKKNYRLSEKLPKGTTYPVRQRAPFPRLRDIEGLEPRDDLQ